MLHFEWLRDRSILRVTPEGPLEQADFEQFAKALAPIIASKGRIAGLLLNAESFPGWRDFGAFFSHLKFVSAHHRQIERIAVVSGSRLLKVLPRIGALFVHPTIRHFGLDEKDQALAWLETDR
jgi:SpoIIAA-like